MTERETARLKTEVVEEESTERPGARAKVQTVRVVGEGVDRRLLLSGPTTLGEILAKVGFEPARLGTTGLGGFTVNRRGREGTLSAGSTVLPGEELVVGLQIVGGL